MSQTIAELRALVPDLFNAGCPAPGIATAGQPTAAELEALATAGYKVVLDLRMPHEPRGFVEDEAVAQLGMRYVAIPVQGMVPDSAFDEVRRLVADPANRPILVHCASANRVGALLLPALVLDQGVPQDQAIVLAKQVGLRDPSLAQMALDYIKRHAAS